MLTLKISSSLGFLAFLVGLDALVLRRLLVKHLSAYLNRICLCKLLFCHSPSSSHLVPLRYCGHGAGHACLPTDRLRSTGRCCSSAFLMGCSSGSLKVENCPFSCFVRAIMLTRVLQSPGFSEAQGPLLHYLLAGWYVLMIRTVSWMFQSQ